MVGVVVLSFETMLTGVKVSQTSTSHSAQSNDARAAFNQLTSDLRLAEKVITEYKKGSIDGVSGADKITLRVPVFNPAGRRVVGQWKIVNYFLKPVAGDDGPYNLIRTTGDVNGNANPNNVTSTNIATNIGNLKLDYFLQQSIPVTGSAVIFPATVTTATPTGNAMRIFEVKAPWAGLNLTDSVDGTIGNGIPTLNLALAGITVLGSGLVTPVLAPAGSKVDMLFQVATNQTRDSDDGIKCNRVNVKLVSDKKMPDRTRQKIELEDNTVLRNN